MRPTRYQFPNRSPVCQKFGLLGTLSYMATRDAVLPELWHCWQATCIDENGAPIYTRSNVAPMVRVDKDIRQATNLVTRHPASLSACTADEPPILPGSRSPEDGATNVSIYSHLAHFQRAG